MHRLSLQLLAEHLWSLPCWLKRPKFPVEPAIHPYPSPIWTNKYGPIASKGEKYLTIESSISTFRSALDVFKEECNEELDRTPFMIISNWYKLYPQYDSQIHTCVELEAIELEINTKNWNIKQWLEISKVLDWASGKLFIRLSSFRLKNSYSHFGN